MIRGYTAVLLCLVASQAVWIAHADPPAPAPEPILQPLAPGQVVRIGPTAGTGTPPGITASAPPICVNSSSSPPNCCKSVGTASPVRGRVRWLVLADRAARRHRVGRRPRRGALHGCHRRDQAVAGRSHAAGDSQLPAGVVQINRRNYLMVATTKDLEPQNSRLVIAEPVHGGWQTVRIAARRLLPGRPSDADQRVLRPDPHPDSQTGWVYIVANSFTRNQSVVLYRATPEAFTDRSRWQGWASGPNGGWNKPPTPLWPDQIGEMCIRQIDGRAVLSYFNASTGDMEVRVATDPRFLGDAPVTTVVQHDEWPEPPESLPPPYDNRLAQPYGGYISPGSTLDELRIFVSQWNNIDPRASAPYRVIQFAVNPFKPD